MSPTACRMSRHLGGAGRIAARRAQRPARSTSCSGLPAGRCGLTSSCRRGAARRGTVLAMARIPVSIADYVGRTPMLELTRIAPAGRAAVRQARVVQSRGQRQGPHRRGDDRGRRGRRADRAGPLDDRRGDLGQHRHRAGVRLRGQGLRPRADAAAGHEPRARGPAAPVRRAGADHRVARRDERGGRRGARDGDEPRRLPARPVLQPGQPRGAPPHDGAGAVGGARRQARRARLRRRHRRHDHRRGGVPQGAQPRR